MGGIARPLLSSMSAPIVRTVTQVQAVDDSVRSFAAHHFAHGVTHDSMLGIALSSLAPLALIVSAGVSVTLIASTSERQRDEAVRCVAALFSVHTLLLLPLVELCIKPAVHRLRPDIEHHHTFSFPSGHTTSATFVSGALFLVLLPRLLDALAAARPYGLPKVTMPPRLALVGMWLATSVATGLGRILVDAHWFSDTVAGALIGALLLAASMQLLEETSEHSASQTGATPAAGMHEAAPTEADGLLQAVRSESDIDHR